MTPIDRILSIIFWLITIGLAINLFAPDTVKQNDMSFTFSLSLACAITHTVEQLASKAK